VNVFRTPQAHTKSRLSICAPIREAVAKISCVEYQNALSGLYEVSRDLGPHEHELGRGKGREGRRIMRAYLVPSECSGPRNEKRLSGCRPYNVSDEHTVRDSKFGTGAGDKPIWVRTWSCECFHQKWRRNPQTYEKRMGAHWHRGPMME
jgi:hypothetical protein